MPERGFASETWDSDVWFQERTKDQRYLFIYLWTNNHCNPSGLYHITLTTISNETLIPKDDLPELLKSLEPKIYWYPEESLVWVCNFIKRQAKSSKFIQAAARSLTTIKSNGAIQDLIDYNQRKYSISIPYKYYFDKVSILTRVTVPDPDTITDSFPVGGEVSLFGSFSLLRNRLIKASKGAIDRLVEHELIKQELSIAGRELGFEPRSEYQTNIGRVDLCYLDSNGNITAAFEIDVYEPRKKSLSKLESLDCPWKFIILRTGEKPHSTQQGVHLIGLGIGGEAASAENDIPASESENVESLSSGDQEVISTWFSVKGIDITPSAAADLVAKMRTEFTDIDILEESKKWSVRKLTEPLTPNSRPASQLWNWMSKAREIKARSPSMSKSRSRDSRKSHKICRGCGYKEFTDAVYCPTCYDKGNYSVLEKDYQGGKYGKFVRQ